MCSHYYQSIKKPAEWGFRCTECETIRAKFHKKKYLNNLRDKFVQRAKKWVVLDDLASGRVVNLNDASVMKDLKYISSFSKNDLSKVGSDLKARIINLRTFLLDMEKDKKENDRHSDPMVRKFIKYWESNPDFKESLVVQLLDISISRLSSKNNSRIPTCLMDFFCLIHSFDNKAASIISANLAGPSIRSIFRKAKADALSMTKRNFINRDGDLLKGIIKQRLKELSKTTPSNKAQAFSLAIDATKVAQVLQFDPRYNAVIGGTGENSFITEVVGDASDSALSRLKKVLKDESITKASEIKVAVVSFQNTGSQSPYLILAGRAQTTNEVSTWNEEIAELCQEASDEFYDECKVLVHFIGAANDRVSCDKDFVVKILSSFLRGDKSFTAATDIPHNVKNMRGQILGLSAATSIGKYVVDVGMASVLPEELTSIVDWANDELVLMAASHKQVTAIFDAPFSDEKTKAVLVLALLFLRMHIAAVQMKEGINYKDRVYMIWSSLICMLHFDGVSIITKRNWIMATVASIFNIMMETVVEPHRCTSEPNEHTFGHARQMCKEFSIRDFCWIVSAIARRFYLIHRNNFAIYRDPVRGYNVGTGANDYTTNWNTNGGPVNVFDNSWKQHSSAASVADCVWFHLRPIVNEVNKLMVPFLKNVFGISEMHILTKQFAANTMHSPADLLQDFLTCMATEQKHHFIANDQMDVVVVGDNLRVEDEDDDNNNNGNNEGSDAVTEQYVEHLIQLNLSVSQSAYKGDAIEYDGNSLDIYRNVDAAPDSSIASSSESIAAQTSVTSAPYPVPTQVPTTTATTKIKDILTTLYSCMSIEEMRQTTVDESSEEIILYLFRAFHMKNRDKGTVNNAQKHKSRDGRIFEKSEKHADNENKKMGGDDEVDQNLQVTIERGSVLEVKLDEDCVKNFVVLAVSDKFHGKWWMNRKERKKLMWPFGKKEIKTRLLVRELQKDKRYGTVTAFKSYDSIPDCRTYHFRKQKPYIIIDDVKKEVQKVIGKIEV